MSSDLRLLAKWFAEVIANAVAIFAAIMVALWVFVLIADEAVEALGF